uniref:Serine/threonine-protein phosphatase PGAM5, mitochondrial n=1 Tax=Syphacia muris TaxID=451379 RepID=A0A0N5ALJ4_9BILA
MAILSRFAKIGIPLAAVVVAGTVLNDNHRHLLTAKALTLDNSYEGFPRRKWDWNWDNRDPITMVDAEKLKDAKSEDERKALIESKKPVAKRNIFLVRHGQYNMHTATKNLTALGREQAALLGKRLAASGKKFDLLIMSTMLRATETAKIILEEMDPMETESDSLLEEGAPYPPEPCLHWYPKQHGSRIEAAFRKYIHRASPKQKEDSYEIIVCHGNVIRYFICRALQFPPEGWLRFSLANTSITWLVISPNGQVVVHAIGDIGHLSTDKISFS